MPNSSTIGTGTETCGLETASEREEEDLSQLYDSQPQNKPADFDKKRKEQKKRMRKLEKKQEEREIVRQFKEEAAGMNKFFEPKIESKPIDLVIDLLSDEEMPEPKLQGFESAGLKMHRKAIVEEVSGGDVMELDECDLIISQNPASRWRDHEDPFAPD